MRFLVKIEISGIRTSADQERAKRALRGPFPEAAITFLTGPNSGKVTVKIDTQGLATPEPQVRTHILTAIGNYGAGKMEILFSTNRPAPLVRE